MSPIHELMRAFWQCLLQDLRGNAVVRASHQGEGRLTHAQRVIIKRAQLREQAWAYLGTPAFENWSLLCGLDPQALQEKLTRATANR